MGLWFNYGDVNGLDFWNNLIQYGPKRNGYGTIQHQKYQHARWPPGSIDALGVSPEGRILLKEHTILFLAIGDEYSIDRITTLTAVDGDVSFKDNKEVRWHPRRELELLADKPDIFTDAKGILTMVKKYWTMKVSMANTQCKWCWRTWLLGKESDWMVLSSHIDKEDISLVILDHPQNVGYPTYWHAGDMQLFTANPLGDRLY